MTKKDREDFNVNADTQLHQAIVAARRAGKRHGDKLISCTMAFELGARILLGLEEDEEDLIKQDIEDLGIQQAAINQKIKLNREQLQLMQASKIVKMSEAEEQNANVQKLAQKIVDVWDNVVIYKKDYMINSLVDVDKKRLTRPMIEAIFPKKIQPKPSIDDAVKIAMNLLEGEMVGA